MAKFYVGQRVRIKWSNHWPELAGEVGTIMSAATTKGVHGISDWDVAPDIWGRVTCPEGHADFSPNESQIEPATDANDLVDWSECLWQPHTETA